MKKHFLLFFLMFGLFTLASAQTINIGLIHDQISQEDKNYLETILKSELSKNFENSKFEPVIKKVVEKNDSNLKELIEKYENDADIDAVISLTASPYSHFSGGDEFKKLVIAPFCHTYSNTARVKNLNAITTDYDLEEAVGIINNLKEIKKLGIIFSDEFKNTAELYKERLIQEDFFNGKDVMTISLEEDPEKVSSTIYKNDALLVLAKNTDSLKKTLEKASKQGIPSFSFLFEKNSDSGVLMGYPVEEEKERKIRVAAVNLLKYYEGREFSELETRLDSTNLNILVDYSVAENTDVYPWDLLSEKINMVNEPSMGKLKLSVVEALEKLLEKNTDLKSKDKKVLASKYDVDIAKSFKKPDVSASLDYQKIDSIRADSDPTTSENTVKAGINLTQVLYDESTFSNIDIQKKLYNAAEEEFRQEELTQIKNLLDSYFNILRSYSNFEIEKYNSTLIKKYLNLAKTKYSIGSSGPEDVYRFESEFADSTTNLEDIRSGIFSGNAGLNRVLNMPMDNYYSLSEDKIEAVINLELFQESQSELNKPWKFESLKKHFIQLGIENYPELKKLDSQIEASERELKSAKRKRYVPTITADANYNKDIAEPWGDGSEELDSEEHWTIGVGFNLPLYKGGELKYTEKQIEAELEQLKIDRETLTSEISKNISSQYAVVFTNIRKMKSAEKSVEASKKNLDLQTDLYAKGKITVTDMLDARNSFIRAEQRAASVKYDLFISISELEKLSGKYYFEYNSSEKEQIKKMFTDLITSKQEAK